MTGHTEIHIPVACYHGVDGAHAETTVWRKLKEELRAIHTEKMTRGEKMGRKISMAQFQSFLPTQYCF